MAPKKNPADQPSLIATFKLFFSSQQQPSQRQMCFFYKLGLFVQPPQSKLYFNSIRKSKIRGGRLLVIGYFVKPQLILKLCSESEMYCMNFKVHLQITKQSSPFMYSQNPYFSCYITNAGNRQYSGIFISKEVVLTRHMSDNLI